MIKFARFGREVELNQEIAVPKPQASFEQGVVRKAARRIYMRQGGFMSCVREDIY